MTDKATMQYKAARALCKRQAEMCGTDERDEWNAYSELYSSDAKAMLEACGGFDLLEAVKDLRSMPNADGTQARALLRLSIKRAARAAVVKATKTEA